jgi:hypothetical protein
MKIRDLIFPMIIIPAGLAFLILCFLLWANHGQNKRLLTAKLGTGAFLLSFSVLAACGQHHITCYEVAPSPNSLSIAPTDSLKASDTLKAYIYSPSWTHYSFSIVNPADGKVVHQGEIMPKSGSFTDYSTEVYMLLPSALNKGKFEILYYGEKTAEIRNDSLLGKSQFTVH